MNSGAAGAAAARMMHLRKIEKGIVPIIDPEEVKTMAEKKLSPVIRAHGWVGGLFILFMFGVWLASPFVFYYLQRWYFMQPDTILFENMTPSVISFFPGIGLAGFLSLAVYFLLKPLIPDLEKASAYSSIITANRMYWGEYSKNVPWERAITKKDVEKVIKEDGSSSTWILLTVFIVSIPVYYLCFTTYRNVTSTTWTESLMGTKQVYQLSDVEKVKATLQLVEETSDGETELTERMALDIYLKGKVEPFEVCNSACYYTQDEVKELITRLESQESVVFEANTLKRFERDFIEGQGSYLLEIHGMVEKSQE